MEDDEKKLLMTPEQAEGLFPKKGQIHSFMQAGPLLIGCDYRRATARRVLREAKSIELAGPEARAMGHPIAVWYKPDEVLFLAADMAKVAEFEAAVADRE